MCLWEAQRTVGLQIRGSAYVLQQVHKCFPQTADSDNTALPCSGRWHGAEGERGHKGPGRCIHGALARGGRAACGGTGLRHHRGTASTPQQPPCCEPWARGCHQLRTPASSFFCSHSWIADVSPLLPPPPPPPHSQGSLWGQRAWKPGGRGWEMGSRWSHVGRSRTRAAGSWLWTVSHRWSKASMGA